MGLGRDVNETKYVPPDFDPAKVGKTLGKRGRERIITTKIQMPMGVQCEGCNEWIAKDKKFLSQRERAPEHDYLGIQVWRLKIRCPRCHAEIAIRNDPQKRDYEVDYGATRLFHARQRERDMEEAARALEDETRGDTLAEANAKVEETKREMSELERLETAMELKDSRAAVTEEQLQAAVRKAHDQAAAKRKEEEEQDEADRLEAERFMRDAQRKLEEAKAAAEAAKLTPAASSWGDALADAELESRPRKRRKVKKKAAAAGGGAAPEDPFGCYASD